MNLKKQILYGAILFGFAISNAFADQFYFGGVPQDLLQAAPSVEYQLCNGYNSNSCLPPATINLTGHLIKIPLTKGYWLARINAVTFSPKSGAASETVTFDPGIDNGAINNDVFYFSYFSLSDEDANVKFTIARAGEKNNQLNERRN